MSNWRSTSNGGKKIDYPHNLKLIASFLGSRGQVDKNVVDRFDREFTKDYVYTTAMFESDKKTEAEFSSLKYKVLNDIRSIMIDVEKHKEKMTQNRKMAIDKMAEFSNFVNSVSKYELSMQKMGKDNAYNSLFQNEQAVTRYAKYIQDEDTKSLEDIKSIKSSVEKCKSLLNNSQGTLSDVKSKTELLFSGIKDNYRKLEAVSHLTTRYYESLLAEIDKAKKGYQTLQDAREQEELQQRAKEKRAFITKLIVIPIVAVLILSVACLALHSHGLNSLGFKYIMDEELGGYVISTGFIEITNSKTEIIIPDEYKGSPIVGIDDEMFQGNTKLVSITIPNTVTKIGKNAFSGCKNLKVVKWGDNITEIGEAAFSSCSSLVEITIPNQVLSISTATFDNCTSLKIVVLPENLASIGHGAFRFCVSLSDLHIPDSVQTIEPEAFAYCEGLTSVTIPEGVTYINENTFGFCKNLTSITLPNTLETISMSAFIDCNNLSEINYNGNKNNWIKINKESSWNSYFQTNTINCLDGEATVYSVTWNLDGGTPKGNLPNEYIYGTGFALESIAPPEKEGMVFCGWYQNNVYTGSVDGNAHGDITLTAKWVKSTYIIPSFSANDSSTNQNKSYNAKEVGKIIIPSELANMIANNKICMIIRGDISTSVQSQGNATATAYTWLYMAPNVALGNGYITTDKCSQSATGGGYTSGFLGIGKEPKDGDKKTNTLNFTISRVLNKYTDEIPLNFLMEYESDKENSDVEISIWGSSANVTYEFRIIN
jgi:uncharacterized repeat protein (TIGR02543 family)